MRLPWSGSSQNLKKIIGIDSQVSSVQLLARLETLYKDLIAETILHLNLSADPGKLLTETLSELTSLLLSSTQEWGRLRNPDMAVLINNLVKAVDWKLGIKGFVYTSERTASLAQQGLVALPALKNVLNDFASDKKQTSRRHLYERYMNTEKDRQAVIERSLRCLITNWRRNITATIFAWNESFQLVFKDDVLDTYLFEQMVLYTHFFKGEKGEIFLATARQELASHVRKFIYGPERDQYVNDIVQETFKVFYEEYSKNREHFFVDMRLKYFLRRLERNRKILNDYLPVEQLDEKIRELEHAAEPEKEREFPEELTEIVKLCMDKLSQECQQIIRTRKFGDYADTISVADLSLILKMDFQVMKSRVRRCDSDLEYCIVDNSARQGYYPL